MVMAGSRIRTSIRAVGRDVAIAVALAALVLLIALAVWPHTGVAGTVSRTVCKAACSLQPVRATITVGHCISGMLTASNRAEYMTWKTESDDKGHFQIDLSPGVYCLSASGSAGYARGAFQVVAGQLTQVSLELQPL